MTDETRVGDGAILRSSMWVASGTALSRVTGLVRVAALTYAVGQTKLGDVYTIANFAPNLVFELVIGGVLSATLVPVFVAARDDRDEDAVSALFTVGLIASAALTLLAFALVAGIDLFAANRIADGIGDAHGAVQHARNLHLVQSSVALLYLMLPQVLFYGVSAMCNAFLNASRRYLAAAFAPVFTNLFTIGAFIVVGMQLQGDRQTLAVTRFSTGPLLWLGLGTTGGIAIMTVPVLWEIRRSGARVRFMPDVHHPAIAKVGRLSLWTFGYVASNQVALLFVYAFAFRSGAGIAKRYSDAFIFFQLPHGLIAVSVMTTMTPELASAAARADFQGVADRFAKGLRLMAVLIIPAAAGYLLLGTPIASVLFERGQNFTARDSELTGHSIAAFAVGLPAFSAYLFANRGFYALSDTRTPFFLNLAENAINIVGVIGVVALGLTASGAFALVYSIAYVIAAALALIAFKRRLVELDPNVRQPGLGAIPRMLLAALVMAAAVGVTRIVLPADHGVAALISLIVSVVVGVACYAAAGQVLGIEEIDATLTVLRKRLRRPRG